MLMASRQNPPRVHVLSGEDERRDRNGQVKSATGLVLTYAPSGIPDSQRYDDDRKHGGEWEFGLHGDCLERVELER